MQQPGITSKYTEPATVLSVSSLEDDHVTLQAIVGHSKARGSAAARCGEGLRRSSRIGAAVQVAHDPDPQSEEPGGSAAWSIGASRRRVWKDCWRKQPPFRSNREGPATRKGAYPSSVSDFVRAAEECISRGMPDVEEAHVEAG